MQAQVYNEIKDFSPSKTKANSVAYDDDFLTLGIKDTEKGNKLFDSVARGHPKDVKIIESIIASDASK